MARTFVTRMPLHLSSKLCAYLQEQGFLLTRPDHTLFQAKKPHVTCTLYASGKLVVQGRAMQELVEFYIEPYILGSPEHTCHQILAMESVDTRPRIGTDEAGKGDYFGPLCVAGVAGDRDAVQLLIEWGVRDSKQLSDRKIQSLAEKIKAKIPHDILCLWPQKYNELYASFKNLNRLLAWCHAQVIRNLCSFPNLQCAVVDKFAQEHVLQHAMKVAGVALPVEQRVRAESDPLVAAASILARWAFLSGLRRLGHGVGCELPKGGAVRAVARALRHTLSQEQFATIAKLHFRTTDET